MPVKKRQFVVKKKAPAKRRVAPRKQAQPSTAPETPVVVQEPQPVIIQPQPVAATPEPVAPQPSVQPPPPQPAPVVVPATQPQEPLKETVVDATDPEAPVEKTEALATAEPEFDMEDEPTGKKNIYFIAFLILLVCGLSVGGYLLYQKYQKQQEAAKRAVITPTPAPTATPTPEEVDLSMYTVDVLNGSGIAGEAKKVGTALEDAGFTTGTLGNAPGNGASETTITAKEDVDKAFLEKLQEALEGEGHKATVSAKSLPESSDADVEVIIGRDE